MPFAPPDTSTPQIEPGENGFRIFKPGTSGNPPVEVGHVYVTGATRFWTNVPTNTEYWSWNGNNAWPHLSFWIEAQSQANKLPNPSSLQGYYGGSQYSFDPNGQKIALPANTAGWRLKTGVAGGNPTTVGWLLLAPNQKLSWFHSSNQNYGYSRLDFQWDTTPAQPDSYYNLLHPDFTPVT